MAHRLLVPARRGQRGAREAPPQWRAAQSTQRTQEAKEGKSDEWLDVAEESDAFAFASSLVLFPDEYAKYGTSRRATRAHSLPSPAVASALATWAVAHPPQAVRPSPRPLCGCGIFQRPSDADPLQAAAVTAATPSGKPIDQMSEDEMNQLMKQLEEKRAKDAAAAAAAA